MKNINKSILIAEATLLTIRRSAYSIEDALYTMLEKTDIPQHVNLEPGWKQMDTKTTIEQGLECSDNVRKIFEEIAQDEVGGLALRVFFQGQRKLGKKLRIIEGNPYTSENGLEQTNIFTYNDFAIYLDLKQLQGVTTAGYHNGQIVEKEENAINILSQEFAYAIHYWH